MAEHDWKQLLDDPEIEGIIRRVHAGPGRRFYYRSLHALSYDDLESWLWDRAVDIAMAYNRKDFTGNFYDSDRHWKAWLYTALNNDIFRGRHLRAMRGRNGSARRETEDATLGSVEHLHETYGDAVFRHENNGIHHHITRDDPLGVILRVDFLERTLAKVIRDAPGYVTETDTTCREPLCTKHTEALGLCQQHYLAYRRNWLTGQCAVDGCTNGAVSKNLCGGHYSAARKERLKDQSCKIEGCQGNVRVRGYCDRHAKQNPAPPKPEHCTAEDCTRPLKARGLCDMHYRRQLRGEAA